MAFDFPHFVIRENQMPFFTYYFYLFYDYIKVPSYIAPVYDMMTMRAVLFTAKIDLQKRTV